MACLWIIAPASAGTLFELDLPLTDETATLAAIQPFGGTVSGGQFGPDGYTSTSRDDIIVIPLPAGLDVRSGRLSSTVQDFEWDLSAEWEQFALVSLNHADAPLNVTESRGQFQAAITTLYRGYNPSDPGMGYHLTVYFNLHDPSCTDWHDCTTETKTNHHWLEQYGHAYTFVNEWAGQVDVATFSGNGTVVETMDLSATSPSGEFYGDQMYLLISACGGSNDNKCGPWNGPNNLKGAPLGVTHSEVRLEIFGDAPAIGFVGGQQGGGLYGWAYDHESPQTEIQVTVLDSPVHTEPTVVGTIVADTLVSAKQEQDIREVIFAGTGAVAPQGIPFGFDDDIAALLLGLPEVTVSGIYRVQLTVLDQQDLAGGSRVLATWPKGQDVFDIDIEIGGDDDDAAGDDDAGDDDVGDDDAGDDDAGGPTGGDDDAAPEETSGCRCVMSYSGRGASSLLVTAVLIAWAVLHRTRV